MYNTIINTHNGGTSIKLEDKTAISEGETIEQKLARILDTNAISDEVEVPLIYTDRKDGVIDMYNIRYDKFEGLIEAKDAITSTRMTETIEKKKADLKAKQEAAEGNDRVDQER